jgi:hypothetical protein
MKCALTECAAEVPAMPVRPGRVYCCAEHQRIDANRRYYARKIAGLARARPGRGRYEGDYERRVIGQLGAAIRWGK